MPRLWPALFADATHRDYHLDPGSPTIDAGTQDIDVALLTELRRRSTSTAGGLHLASVDLGYHCPVGQ